MKCCLILVLLGVLVCLGTTKAGHGKCCKKEEHCNEEIDASGKKEVEKESFGLEQENDATGTTKLDCGKYIKESDYDFTKDKNNCKKQGK